MSTKYERELREADVIRRAVQAAGDRAQQNPLFGGLRPYVSFDAIVNDDAVVAQGWTDSKVRSAVRTAVRLGRIRERKLARSKGYSV